MKLGVLKESFFQRVSLVPQSAKKLTNLGLELYVEDAAGEQAGFIDSDYRAEGWKEENRDWILTNCDVIPVIHPLSAEEMGKLKEKSVLISMFEPFNKPQVLDELKPYPVYAFSMDMIPRVTLAQSMDVLSSMASLAGYKAVLIGADHYDNMFPMMMTAAGTIPPAKVLVLGAGVAGLQAIATAKRLGGVIEAFDTRAAAKEEVQSLGAKFVEVEGAKDDTSAGGYAVEQTEEYIQKQRALVQEKATQSNIIITTAQVRGRKAPLLITEDTVKHMRSGSVVIDLAASTGGNCAFTEDNKIIKVGGVTIVGNSNLADQVPRVASILFGNNLLKFMELFVKEGQLIINEEDEIISSSLISKPA